MTTAETIMRAIAAWRNARKDVRKAAEERLTLAKSLEEIEKERTRAITAEKDAKDKLDFLIERAVQGEGEEH